MVQYFSKSMLIADYYSNTAGYAKNCENKARPKLQCNGKCQLMKKLNAEEKKDQDNPERKAENKNEWFVFYRASFANAPKPIIIITSNKISIRHLNDHCADRSLDIFHPPQV